jgi:hypothetical protein
MTNEERIGIGESMGRMYGKADGVERRKERRKDDTPLR